MRRLYAGPWVGEFGWEICSWNPAIRHIAEDYDHITVEIQPGMEYLYEFADTIITNPHLPNFDMYSGKVSKPEFKPPNGTESIIPRLFWRSHARAEFRAISHVNGNYQPPPKKWREYGTEKPRKVADIMCAWRGKKEYKNRSFPEKQYPDKHCIALTKLFLKAGYSVACYGGKDNLYVDGTLDFRGVSLVELCGALSRADLVVGPSSGTIHMASLCGAPHITWFGKYSNSMDRYLSYWNPFETPVTFIGGNYPPTPEKVFQHGIERMDQNTKNLEWVSR